MHPVRIAVESNKVGSYQGSKGKWVRKQLDEAIERKLKPALINQTNVDSFTVRLPQNLCDALNEIAADHGLCISMACAGLIKSTTQADSPDKQGSKTEVSEGYVSDRLLSNVRSELHKWLEQGASEASQGKIALMEAATGSGKGRAICAAALAHLDAGHTVTICAPLEIIFQIAETFDVFDHACSQDYSILLGRPNFINDRFVLDYALETGNHALAEWIKDGGQPQSARVRNYADKAGCNLAFLLEDALYLDSDLPVREARLNSGDECEANQVYLEAREYSIEQPILLMSHHMLAAGSFLKESEEGNPQSFFRKNDQLIVDEAHLFEEALASLSSTSIHVSTLPRKLSGYPAAKKAAQALLDAASKTYARLSANSKKANQFFFGNAMSFPSLYSSLIDLNAAIKSCVKGAAKKRELRTYIQGLQRIQADLKNQYSMTRLSASRVKMHPVINSGSFMLKSQLTNIWSNFSGVMLVSATILNGKGEASLFKWMLHIPESRMATLSPVTPKWIAESLEIKFDFTENSDFTSDEWIDEVAAKCFEKAQNARWGTLILNTSFDNCQRLHDRLHPLLGDRLITQGADKSAGECKRQYIELYHKGIMPIWIGVGQAWVGVDLTDPLVDPSEDHMLSELIIPKLPYGANQSMTSQYRKSVSGFAVTAQEAGWLLRQGIGRLVRRQGCPKKTVWILDKRIADPVHQALSKNLDRYRVPKSLLGK